MSIVVPTRNRAMFLPAAMNSMQEQKCTASFEVIVVDNGSEDSTSEVIRAAGRSDPRVRGVVERTVGLSHAKNAGIKAARGRLVLFTDDDVLLDENWIEAYVEFFGRSSSTSIVAGGPVLAVPRDLSDWPPWVLAETRADLPSLHYGEQERLLCKDEWLWGANMAAPRDLLAALGGFRTELGRGARPTTYEDVDLVDRVRQMGGQAWYSPAAQVRHRVDPKAGQPRQILLTAFNRGSNDCAGSRRGTFEVAGVPRGRVGAGLALPALLTFVAGASAGFRMTARPRTLDAARRASWCAGWCFWLLVGESPRRRARIVRSLIWGLRRFAFGAAPP